MHRQKPFISIVFILYLVGIHILSVMLMASIVGLYSPSFLESNKQKRIIKEQFNQSVIFHGRIDKNLPSGVVIFIGDSIIKGLAISAVHPLSVNFGIGHDTTAGVIQRLPTYKSIKKASLIVLGIGVNDLGRLSNAEITRNYATIFGLIPEDKLVLLSKILPIDESLKSKNGYNARIISLNRVLDKFCAEVARLECLDIGPLLVNEKGNLSSDFHIGDGIHLNSVGYHVWIKALKKKIKMIFNKTQ